MELRRKKPHPNPNPQPTDRVTHAELASAVRQVRALAQTDMNITRAAEQSDVGGLVGRVAHLEADVTGLRGELAALESRVAVLEMLIS